MERPRSLRTPRLTRVSLKNARKHDCPDVSLRKRYLVKIEDDFYVGHFEREWYGLNFVGSGWSEVSIQFDAPGENSSGWQGVWELRA